MTVVHQVLSGAGPFDAVTSEALAFRERFARWGWRGTDAAAARHPDVADRIAELAALRPAPQDVLLLHYSAFAPGIEPVLALPNPKVLLSHNVTPARWLWEHDPMIAAQCAIGRAQLPGYVERCDLFAADSEYNAQELREAGAREVAVLPVLADPARLGPPGDGDAEGPPSLLFVGRLMPHKRQDELIRLLALHRAEHAPDARLVLVGEPLNADYGARLRALADRLAPGAVAFERHLPAAELAARYRSAHAFVCLSEHEGFCIPVLEALHFRLPVVARRRGAVPEVAGDAALWCDDDDLAVVSELVHLSLTDGDLRAELRRRGGARVRALAPERTEAALRTLVERAQS
jgi:L-malate glycosyltransferase